MVERIGDAELRSETLEEYHSDAEFYSKSMLLEYDEDPVMFNMRYNLKDPRLPAKKSTRQMDIGTAIHDCALNGMDLNDIVRTFGRESINKSGGLIGVNAAKERETEPDKIWLKQEDADRVAECIATLKSGPLGDAIAASTGIESSFRWIEDGVRCRMRPDFWAEYEDHIMVVDLKCSEDISNTGFMRSMYSCGWWLQSAHYSAGMFHAFRKPIRFMFWSIETNYPYRQKQRWLDPRSCELVFEKRRDIIHRLAKSMTLDEWDNKQESAVTIWPKWEDR